MKQSNSNNLSQIPEFGDTVKCWREDDKQYIRCKILSVRETNRKESKFYVSYDNINKRFDEWVTIDMFDLSTLSKNLANQSTKRPRQETEQSCEADLRFLGITRNVEYLRLGDFKIKAWYFSPLPEPYYDLEVLYCCEFCMHFFQTEPEFIDHCCRCTTTHPPGDEIYRKGNVSVYEVDGSYSTRWCINLCLITKLFLYHKTAYYDPTPFHFYVICFNDIRGARPCGFFSKEKKFDCANNLACILAFPPYHRSGVGRFLISLSYEFSKIEKRPGSPEKPLSDLGLVAYRSFWKSALIQCLILHKGQQLSISQISQETAMTENDIKFAARDGGFIVKAEDKEWVFGVTSKQIADWKKKENQRRLKMDPRFIRWTPHFRRETNR